jgi:hypothetical protein
MMPMIPALVFMFWCDLYPKWLRLALEVLWGVYLWRDWKHGRA